MRAEQEFALTEVVSGGTVYHAFDIPYRNIYDTLSATAARFPEKTGVIDDSREITYGQLKKDVDSFSAYLSAFCGVGIKSRVALMMLNSIDFCIAFYAVQKLGAAVISINTKLSGDEVRFILRDSSPECIIMDRIWLPKAENAVRAFQIAHCILSGDHAASPYPTIAACIDAGAKLPTPPAVQDDALPAEIMYTSGTTGKPKAAVMTHFNLLQGLYVYAKADELDETERTVLSIPVFHITGLNCVLTLFVFLGGLLVLVPYFDATSTLDKMTKYRATYIHAVSTVFILLESAIQERHDLSSLRNALCGGGFISRETIGRFCRKAVNCKFHPVYGMTETSGAGTYQYGHCLNADIRDSCGKTVENCSIKIIAPDGQEVPPGMNGEICFRGPFVISGYLNASGNENIVDGWLHSGDIGSFDDKGNLYIKDRIKDMINRGGEKIFSLAVEAAIMEFKGIHQSAVFSVSDSLYGEVVGAVIVPESGCTISVDELKQFLRNRLAHYKVPTYIEIRSTLPTTANEKVKKNELRREFEQKYAR